LQACDNAEEASHVVQHVLEQCFHEDLHSYVREQSVATKGRMVATRKQPILTA
jgi:hypothetical protein